MGYEPRSLISLSFYILVYVVHRFLNSKEVDKILLDVIARVYKYIINSIKIIL